MEENGLANWRDYFEDWPDDPAKRAQIYANRRWDLPEEFHYTRWTGERTAAAIEQSGDRPFFIWSSFHDPHPPYLVPDPWAGMYDPADMEPGRLVPGEHDRNPPHFQKTLEDDPAWWAEATQGEPIHGSGCHLHDEAALRKNVACYYGMVSFMDREIGRVLEALDRSGKADNTIVIFTSDHGHFLGQHGLVAKAIHMYEDLLKIPFIARWPGHIPAGEIRDDLQCLVDLAPTFLAAADVPVPGAMTGSNQLANWQSGEDARSSVVVENHHGARCFHMRSLVTDRYKITVYRDGNDGELFDLEADPDELHNLWHEPSAATLKSELFHQFLQTTLREEPMRMPRISAA